MLAYASSKQLEGSQVLFSMEVEDCDRCYMLMNYNGRKIKRTVNTLMYARLNIAPFSQ